MMPPAPGSMAPPQMAPPPMLQQAPQQHPPPPQAAPQYHQPHQHQPQGPAPPMWNQQPSQVPPPVPAPQQHQLQPVQVSVPQPQPMPQQQPQMQYQAPMSAGHPASPDGIRTLWIGDLQYWMEENYIYGCFSSTGEVVSVKVIRNKQTGQSEGYGFIDFASHATADAVIQGYNGATMPNTDKKFRLNWATSGEKWDDSAASEQGSTAVRVQPQQDADQWNNAYYGYGGQGYEFYGYAQPAQDPNMYAYGSILDLEFASHSTTDAVIQGYSGATMPNTEQQFRLNWATSEAKQEDSSGQTVSVWDLAPDAAYHVLQETFKTHYSSDDPNNTTIFVGGLDSSVTDENLRQIFCQYGDLVHVKIIVGKHCGFVQFAERACAEKALLMLNGALLGGLNISLSWGPSDASKQDSNAVWVQPQQDANQWYNAYYGYGGQGYKSYGYAQPAQDPNIYAYGSTLDMESASHSSTDAVIQGYSNTEQEFRLNWTTSGEKQDDSSGHTVSVGDLAADVADLVLQETFKTHYSSDDPNNTTIFVSGLDSSVTDENLRQIFGQYGDLVHVKITVAKHCGFVQFAERASAEEALLMLNGALLGGLNISLSWGPSDASKQDSNTVWVQPHQDAKQWNNAYYGYGGQGYESYGYAQPAQDPNMFAYGSAPDMESATNSLNSN